MWLRVWRPLPGLTNRSLPFPALIHGMYRPLADEAGKQKDGLQLADELREHILERLRAIDHCAKSLEVRSVRVFDLRLAVDERQGHGTIRRQFRDRLRYLVEPPVRFEKQTLRARENRAFAIRKPWRELERALVPLRDGVKRGLAALPARDRIDRSSISKIDRRRPSPAPEKQSSRAAAQD